MLNVALFPEPPMAVSAFNSSTYVGLISTKIFDGLVTYTYDMKPQPLLATSWEIAPDGLTYTFKLRPNVKWHDGKPFTSADVRYSLEKVWSKMHPRGRTTYQNVTSVETPDDTTIVLKLSKPTPILMKSLSSYRSQVIPKHIFDDGTDLAKHPGMNAPIGTGPFVFKEWKKGEYILMERNPNYWDQPKPYLDKIVWKIIPDAAARAAALETGEADFTAFSAVSISDIKRLASLPKLAAETKGYEYLAPLFLLELNNRNEYLAKVEVRQAISHAIDRKFLIDNIWEGYGTVLTGPIPPTNVEYYTKDVPDSVSYDPKKAAELLDKAGLQGRGRGQALQAAARGRGRLRYAAALGRVHQAGARQGRHRCRAAQHRPRRLHQARLQRLRLRHDDERHLRHAGSDNRRSAPLLGPEHQEGRAVRQRLRLLRTPTWTRRSRAPRPRTTRPSARRCSSTCRRSLRATCR